MELRRFRRTLRQVFLLPVIACLLLAALLVWQVHGANATVQLIEQSDRKIALSTRLEKLVIDEETGLRGYQITSDPRFLQPYRSAAGPLQKTAAELRAILVTDQQRQVLDQFLNEHQIWHDTFAEPLIATIRAGGHANDDDINLTGRARINSIRRLLSELVETSENRRAERIEAWRRQTRDGFVVVFLIALASGLGIGLFTHNRFDVVSAQFRMSLEAQQQRAEELFRSEQNLRTTLASIGDGVITCDTEGRIQLMNPVAQEITGWLESEARGRPLGEVFRIINEDSRKAIESPVEKVIEFDRVVGLANHTVLIRKDGSEVPIDDSGAPIRKESGEMIGVVLVFRDITVQRRTRAALLANEKLAVAGRLAATIAHEIHNPLDSVANLLYLLQHNPNDPEAPHFLEIAQSELNRVTQISRAMLSLYRESKAPVRVNLKEMIEDLILLIEGRFHPLGVNISASLPNGIVVEGYPAELRQVFTNLITNAAESAGEGGTVRVSIETQSAGVSPYGEKIPEGAIVEVTDNGSGIPPEIQNQLFRPFFTTKGERGTGLGLWVSQGIIRKHGGRIELFNNDSERGATARIFLASKPVIEPAAV